MEWSLEYGGYVNSEPPRPQPKATLSLLCLLILAVSAQAWSWSVLARHKREQMRFHRYSHVNDEAEDEGEAEEHFDTEQPHIKESVSLRFARTLDWAPRDPSLFLPRLFRETPPAPAVELPTEDVDDERLINAFSELDPEVNAQTNMQTERAEGDVELALVMVDVTQSQNPDHSVPSKFQTKGTSQFQKDPLIQKKRTISKRITPSHLDPLAESNVMKSGMDSSSRITSGTVIEMKPVEVDLNESQEAELSWTNRPRQVGKMGGIPLLSIEDPKHSMKNFFNRLAQSKSGRKVRIMHYGDSLIAGDYVTSTMRRLLQKKFGYGGLGYVLAGNPSPWYGRTGLKIKSKHWKADRATRSTSDLSSYGLGGVSFRSKLKYAYLRAEVLKQDQIDASVDTLEIHFLAQPNGGQFSVNFGPTHQVVSTQAEILAPAQVKIKAPLGLHKVEIRPEGDGEVALLGMSLERSGGGVVYDSLGLTGSRAQQQLKWDRSHWVQQARWRNPDLFVLHYGTNESENSKMSMSKYANVLERVIQRHRAANPQASCLFVSPMDRAYKNEETGRISTRPIIPQIVKTQRMVALAQGCAFWSAYDAMGGWGSLKRWYRASPPLAGGDLTHPTRRGANLLGAMFFSALMEAYAKVAEP